MKDSTIALITLTLLSVFIASTGGSSQTKSEKSQSTIVFYSADANVTVSKVKTYISKGYTVQSWVTADDENTGPEWVHNYVIMTKH